MKTKLSPSLLKNTYLKILASRTHPGWDQPRLHELVTTAKTMIRNFELMTRQSYSLKLFLAPGSDRIMIHQERHELELGLNASPNKLCADAPLQLSRCLIDLVCELATTQRPAFRIVFPDPSARIAVKLDPIIEYFQENRRVIVSPNSLHELLCEVAARIGTDLGRQRLSIDLFRNSPLPKAALLAELEIVLNSLQSFIQNPIIESNKVNSIALIAHAASLAVLARRLGHPELAFRCASLLAGPSGRHLAYIELANLGLTNVKRYQDQPLAMRQQLEQAEGGFHLIFNLLEGVLENYYDLTTVTAPQPTSVV